MEIELGVGGQENSMIQRRGGFGEVMSFVRVNQHRPSPPHLTVGTLHTYVCMARLTSRKLDESQGLACIYSRYSTLERKARQGLQLIN